MKKYIERYIVEYATCQKTKNNTYSTNVETILIIFQSKVKLFKVTSMDFITRLPEFHKYNAVLVGVDQECSKNATFISCTDKITVKKTAKLHQ